jgi:GH24 family phage-related lysozyme (muramidase)
LAVLKLQTIHIAALGVLALVLLGSNFKKRLLDKLAEFIPSVEGFEAHPYWDVSRYSWGYGTAAPGKTGTITREQAFEDMVAYLLADYNTLSKRITRRLTVNQWAAYLSFSYNLGIGNALNLVSLINQGNNTALGTKWNQYIHAAGQVNQTLVARRQREWALFNT